MIGSDLREFLDDSGVLDRETPEPGERLGSIFWATLLDEPAGGLGQEDASNEKNNSPGKLDGNRDPVRASVVTMLSSVVDDSSKKETDGDGKLISANNNTTDPLGSSLGLVQRNSSGDHTDTETSEEAASNEKRDFNGDSLENDTEAEDDVASNQAEAATKEVGRWGSSKCTEEGTSREDGDNQGGLGGVDIQLALVVPVACAEVVLPVLHTKDATDGTSIISEEDTTESNK